MMETKLLSIVIPIYNEGANIVANLGVIRDILVKASIPHEMVLVDDGSSDNTWEELERAAVLYGNVRASRFSRNFGKEAALMAGLDMAAGDACVVLDADLQHPPQLIPEMVRLWREDGWQVVEAVKTSRGRESLFHKLSAGLFYRTMDRMTGIPMQNASDFKLLDRAVYESVRALPERYTFFRGLSAWVGYRRIAISFEVAERAGGVSKWSLRSLIRLAVIAITSFSSAPLQFVTTIGVVFVIGSLLLAVQTLVNYLTGHAVGGFTTVILLLLIIGGILMVSLGLIGTYLARIFDEVKGRPRYIVASLLRSPDADAGVADRGVMHAGSAQGGREAMEP